MESQVANSGAKRRDWHGVRMQEKGFELQVSVLCQAGHLGAKGGPHTSVYMHVCARLFFDFAFTLHSQLVWGAVAETKLAWADSYTVMKAPEG